MAFSLQVCFSVLERKDDFVRASDLAFDPRQRAMAGKLVDQLLVEGKHFIELVFKLDSMHYRRLGF